jgi:hypothetical protein
LFKFTDGLTPSSRNFLGKKNKINDLNWNKHIKQDELPPPITNPDGFTYLETPPRLPKMTFTEATFANIRERTGKCTFGEYWLPEEISTSF